MAEHEEHQYHPKDAIGDTIQATLVTGGAGLFVSSVQNTLRKQNIGAFGVFTRTGGTVGTFGEHYHMKELDLGADTRANRFAAGIGAAYSFASTASANLRQKDDTWNQAIGGFFGGSVLGLACTCGSRSHRMADLLTFDD